MIDPEDKKVINTINVEKKLKIASTCNDITQNDNSNEREKLNISEIDAQMIDSEDD